MTDTNYNDMRTKYAGAIQILCDACVQVDDDTRESIHKAVGDWCELTGWSYEIVMDSINVYPPD